MNENFNFKDIKRAVERISASGEVDTIRLLVHPNGKLLIQYADNIRGTEHTITIFTTDMSMFPEITNTERL